MTICAGKAGRYEVRSGEDGKEIYLLKIIEECRRPAGDCRAGPVSPVSQGWDLLWGDP